MNTLQVHIKEKNVFINLIWLFKQGSEGLQSKHNKSQATQRSSKLQLKVQQVTSYSKLK